MIAIGNSNDRALAALAVERLGDESAARARSSDLGARAIDLA